MNNFMDLISMKEISASSDNVVKKYSSGDIAIIGMSARLPGVDSVSQFWNKIARGTDFIGYIPEQRKKDLEDYFNFIGRLEQEHNFEEGAYLSHIDNFDYGFFNISPNEAAFMDPNQRLFLETAWETIEDAGYGSNKIMGSKTAVFVGFCNEPEYKKLIYDVVDPSFYSMSVPGNLSPIIASRISYLLDLKGPSMIVNTLCSSSLVALHLGCQSLKNDECSMALIGGVQINLLPIRQVKMGIESSSKRTRTFDHQSDGTGTGEGVIAVLLKPLDKAIKDEDNIYAVIKGSAYNQDGASAGLTAPNPAAQEDVIIKAWQEAGVDPETISYIEAHGTGTRLGDPIEIDGIQRAFRKYTDKRQFCAIGSVKSNIGHLDASAGLAGLLKAVLALQKGQIPPTINFDRPNKMIAFHESPVYVNTKLKEWETNGFPRRCGVSSFGFSGTNCHVILEEAPPMDAGKDKKDIKGGENRILTLSAKTEWSLERLVTLYSKLDYDELGWENVCYSASNGRTHYNCRLAIIAESKEDLKRKLERFIQLGIKSSNENGIYYNKFKIINENKTLREHGEITKEEKRTIDCHAKTLLETIKSKDDLNSETLIEICELYVKGAEIEWEVPYQFSPKRKVRLPVYPFNSRRCWVNIPGNSKYNPEEFFFTRNWYREKLNKSNLKRGKGVTLVISNSPIGQEMAKTIGSKVIEVIISNRFKKLNNGLYFISNSEDDFKGLLNEIGAEKVTQIIYNVLPKGIAGESLSGFEAKFSKVLYSFLHLIKSLMADNLNNLDMVLVGRCASCVDGSEKEINAEYAALFGLGKVANVEDYRIKCRCIDIDDKTSISELLKEIKLGQDYNVAYRNGERYVQEIMEINPIKLKNRVAQIREGGVYVITGGMGGIGLNIASYLALKAKVKIILINRTRYPEREKWDLNYEINSDVADKLNKILHIEKNGSSVEICTADVAKYEEIKGALDGIRSKHGKINGIIHSAGIGVGRQGRTLKEESLEDFVHVISPKMQGACLLEELTKEDVLDFFVVFSSPITLIGAVGSGSYTAANAYIESFAEARNIGKKNTICISWAPWGKTIEASKESFRGNKHMFEVLSTEDLIRSFEIVMDKDINSVIVGRLKYTSDLFGLKGVLPFHLSEGIKNKIQTLREDKKTDKTLVFSDMLPKVILKGRESDFYSENENFIASVWGNTLGYNELRIDDNFYELGGDSINAMKIINRINTEKNMGLNVRDLLSNLTIEEMAACVENKQAKLNNVQYSLIPKIEKKNYYSVSMEQKRTYLLAIKKHRDIGWNMSWVFNLKGRFDINKLEQVFKLLIDRHETLRTSFSLMKNEIVQIIEDSIEFSIVQEELNDRKIDQVAREFIKPFKLDKAPLFRVGLFKVHDEEHFLIFDIHHIIADAASMQVMLQDMTSIYKGMDLPAMPIQYKDYSEWQNNLLASGFFEKQREYWVNKFIGDVTPLDLPFDNISSEEITSEGNKIYAEIGENLTYELKRLSEKMGVSLFVTLVSAFYILIYKFSSQKDITIGVPISGRTHSNLENLIGVFVNIIVLKCSLRDEMTYEDLLMAVSKDFLESCDNCDYPYFELVKELKSYIGNKKSPISNILFVMQNTGSKEIELDSGLTITPYEHVNLASKDDILLEAIEKEKKIQLIFEYNTKLFRKNTIDSLINLYRKIIDDVCGNSNIMIKELGSNIS